MGSTYLLQPDQIRRAQGLSISYVTPGAAPVTIPASPSTLFDWRRSPTGSFPFTVVLQGTLMIPVEGTYRLALANTVADQITLNGRPFDHEHLAPGLYDVTIRAHVSGPTKTQLIWRDNGGSAQVVPSSMVLRRGLPPWGLSEQQIFLGGGTPLSHWVPLIWNLPTTSQPPIREDISSEIKVPVSGLYSLALRGSAQMTAIVDGHSLPISSDSNAHVMIQLAAGWHSFHVIVPALSAQGLWIYLDWTRRARRDIIGGPTTRYSPP